MLKEKMRCFWKYLILLVLIAVLFVITKAAWWCSKKFSSLRPIQCDHGDISNSTAMLYAVYGSDIQLTKSITYHAHVGDFLIENNHVIEVVDSSSQPHIFSNSMLNVPIVLCVQIIVLYVYCWAHYSRYHEYAHGLLCFVLLWLYQIS